MNRGVVGIAAVLGLCVTVFGAGAGDQGTFELTAVAPPDMALKYQLLFDSTERTEGNAADIYINVAQIISQDNDHTIENALDAIKTDDQTFEPLAQQLIEANRDILDKLDAAGRCDQCVWPAQVDAATVMTKLPELNNVRRIANLLRIAATRQARQGDIVAAIQSLRLGYELARKQAQEPFLISGLVSIGAAAVVSEGLKELMNRPESPNLYWALATLPRPMFSLAYSMEGERRVFHNTIPSLAKARSGDISGDDLIQAIHEIDTYAATTGKPQPPVDDAAVKAELMSQLPQAQEYYAKSRAMTADDVAKLDPMKVIATYYFEDYQRQADEMMKPLELPMPEMLAKLEQSDQDLKSAKAADPRNPFLALMPSVSRAGKTYARIERQIAALTAVEAIRSYAAANKGQLPANLSDVKDTPVPVNPATGKAFDYTSDETTATLSDSQLDAPLTYTIHIRK